jgi:hypothetical protein
MTAEIIALLYIGKFMNAWEIIFIQSKVNNSIYNGDSLLPHNWAWPRETWFQERLRHLRKQQRQKLVNPDFAIGINLKSEERTFSLC